MAAGKYDMVIDQGADFTLQLVVKDNDVPMDITGYSARAHLRQKVTDPDTNPDAVFTCTVTSPSVGEILMEMDHTITRGLVGGHYVYDLEIYTQDSLGDDDVVIRLLQGKAFISPEVTR